MKKSIVLWLILLTIGVVTRLGIGIPNLALVGAVAFFAGQQLNLMRSSLTLVVSILLLTDLVLGFYPGMEWVYLGYGFYILGGRWVQGASYFKQGTVLTLASMGFFILSNLGVWLSTHLYPATGAGLMNCYLMALPFHQTTLMSDLIGFALLASSLAICKSIEQRALLVK